MEHWQPDEPQIVHELLQAAHVIYSHLEYVLLSKHEALHIRDLVWLFATALELKDLSSTFTRTVQEAWKVA